MSGLPDLPALSLLKSHRLSQTGLVLWVEHLSITVLRLGRVVGSQDGLSGFHPAGVLGKVLPPFSPEREIFLLPTPMESHHSRAPRLGAFPSLSPQPGDAVSAHYTTPRSSVGM